MLLLEIEVHNFFIYSFTADRWLIKIALAHCRLPPVCVTLQKMYNFLNIVEVVFRLCSSTACWAFGLEQSNVKINHYGNENFGMERERSNVPFAEAFNLNNGKLWWGMQLTLIWQQWVLTIFRDFFLWDLKIEIGLSCWNSVQGHFFATGNRLVVVWNRNFV
jgi:hypothetical protein